MSCRTNFGKPHIVKMSDTRFYCCDEYKNDDDFNNYHWKYCAYCGQRLTINGS